MTFINWGARKILALSTLTMMLMSLAIILPSTPAMAQTMIMPLRVTFEGRDRMQEITLFNPSNRAPVTYKLMLLNRAMTEDGNYKVLEAPLNPEFNPETAFVFSPRQVTLPPNGKQKIRISLRKPADLPDGEYRAHLNLQRVGASNSRNINNNVDGLSLKMGMNFGIAIPMIVRQGTYDTTATIGTPSFTPASADRKTPAKVNFAISRNGKYSANGNVNVYWTPTGGKEQLIATRNAVKIYHEVAKLQMSIPLKQGITNISGGTLRITFEGADPDEGIKFDEKTFPIGG